MASKRKAARYEEKVDERPKDTMIVYDNPDKIGWTESWFKERFPDCIPHPFRGCMIGGSSKEELKLICRHLSAHNKMGSEQTKLRNGKKQPTPGAGPHFERIIIVHNIAHNAEDKFRALNIVPGVEFRNEIPDPEDFFPPSRSVQEPMPWGRHLKTLIIFDRVDFKKLEKVFTQFCYASTHHSISFMILNDRPLSYHFNNGLNLFTFWANDSFRYPTLEGIRLRSLFKKYCPLGTDNLTVDDTQYPSRLRKNFDEFIKDNS